MDLVCQVYVETSSDDSCVDGIGRLMIGIDHETQSNNESVVSRLTLYFQLLRVVLSTFGGVKLTSFVITCPCM